MISTPPLLVVDRLSVHYTSDIGALPALHQVSFELGRGESLGIIGETGSGKSTLARSILGLLPGADLQGSINYDGHEIAGASEDNLSRLRWQRIALAFQGVGGGFDPVYTMGQQIGESMHTHLGLDRKTVKTRTLALLERVGLESTHYDFYPHQLSGGQKQRAMIAMALACDPELLIVDEPTTGLDVMNQAQVLDLLADLRAERNLTLIVISHNLADIIRLADRTAVLYGGRIMEVGQTAQLFDDPHHPYTWGLLGAFPTMTTSKDLRGIRGTPPPPGVTIPGCPFHPRCSQAIHECASDVPELLSNGDLSRQVSCLRGGLVTLLDARRLSKTFTGKTGLLGTRPRQVVKAVDDVSLHIRNGEVVAIVGQSGSGKTTLAKLLLRLIEPEGGEVVFDGRTMGTLAGDDLKRVRREIQIIFQEPLEAISPRLTIGEIVREPLDIQQIGTPAERQAAAASALQDVNLPASPEFLTRFPHQVSGGQAQRVVIARALVLSPRLLVADEPVSMLDASEQAKVLELLKTLQNERGIALLLISHDLALVRKVADRILVMHNGRIIESGTTQRVLADAQSEHTRALIAASPRLFIG